MAPIIEDTVHPKPSTRHLHIQNRSPDEQGPESCNCAFCLLAYPTLHFVNSQIDDLHRGGRWPINDDPYTRSKIRYKCAIHDNVDVVLLVIICIYPKSIDIYVCIRRLGSALAWWGIQKIHANLDHRSQEQKCHVFIDSLHLLYKSDWYPGGETQDTLLASWSPSVIPSSINIVKFKYLFLLSENPSLYMHVLGACFPATLDTNSNPKRLIVGPVSNGRSDVCITRARHL